MGSSGGSGDYQAPNIPAPPANLINPVGQSVPYRPQYTSFLPDDPTAMATGLTPEMIASITGSGGGPPPPSVAPASNELNDLRNQLAALQAQNQQRPTGGYQHRGGREGDTVWVQNGGRGAQRGRAGFGQQQWRGGGG